MKHFQNSVESVKWLIVLTLLLANVVCSSAKLFLSDATNDVYIGVSGDSIINFTNADWVTNNMPIHYDDTIAIIAFCNTGAVNLLIPVNNRIFVKVQMRDAAGKEVTKTKEGEQWGSDLKHFPSKPGMNNHDRMASWGASGSHTNEFFGFTTGYSIPSPKDLFVMTNSGIYNLTLEVHLMKQHMLGTTNALGTPTWTWDHIAIPPVTVKVEKP
jgi:hypothetical protein